MGISATLWRCPKCNVDIGGSLGELKNHWKRTHASSKTTITNLETSSEHVD